MTEILREQFNNLESSVSPEIFRNHEDAVFWVEKIAINGKTIVPEYLEYYDALTRFRAEKYLSLGFIASEEVDNQGRDIDKEEARSTSFVVVKKSSEEPSLRADIVGSGRLIRKNVNGGPLPIEREFFELFKERPLPNNSVEISRFIATDPYRNTQHLIGLAMIRSFFYEFEKNKLDNIYCMVEKPLIRLLTFLGISNQILGDPKDISELGGILYPVRIISSSQSLKFLKSDMFKSTDLRSFFIDKNRGIGFYDEKFIGV